MHDRAPVRPLADAATPPLRRRRWPIALAVLAVAVLAYGLALGWAANRLGDDVARSMRLDPGLPAADVPAP